MARPLFLAFAVLLACAAPAAAHDWCEAAQQRAAQQPQAGRGDRGRDGRQGDRDAHNGPRHYWWIDQPERGQLGITDQQSAAVEQVWQRSIPALKDARMKLDKLEAALTLLTNDDRTDEAQVMAQIDRVETMRAEASKLRTLMIYRMNKILTPDQRAKVKAMFERDPQRRGPSSK